MTGDELERAIDFLLKSQANHEARMQEIIERQAKTDEQLAQTDEQLAKTDEQLAKTAEQLRQLSERVDSFADTQRHIMQVMMQTLEAQAKANKDFRASDNALIASDESLRAALTELAMRQERTEATVDRLSQKVEDLVKVVEEDRNRGR